MPTFHSSLGPAGARARGVALVGALLLLAVMMLLGLGMALSTSSDMFINGYYRNFRGSFYAADSGLNIARQRLINQTLAAVPNTFASGSPPIPAGTDASVRSTVLGAYSSPFALNSGYGDNTWTGSFRLTGLTYQLASTPPQPVVTATDASGLPTGYQYTYNYSITSEGTTTTGGQTTLQESGSIIFNATVQPGGPMQLSFAAWGMFINEYAVCSGSYLVPGTITGPVFTNGGWTFGTAGQYVFTDPVGSVSATAGYYFTSYGQCFSSPNDSYRYRSQTISPVFQAGFNKAQNPVALPVNDFSQKRAVLDGQGTNTAPVTPAEMSAVLKRADGSAYSSSATSGVYMPYRVIDGVPTVTGGGIYVEGSASVVMSVSGTSIQRFQITQSGITSTITINLSNQTTTFTTGGTTVNLAGVPTNQLGASPAPATMLYVNGDITSLRGPGPGQPAVQDGAAITITAQNNITITGDVLYRTPPVTRVQNEIPGMPADTLIPGNDKGQVLGIFTARGDVRLNNQQSNRMLEIDASIATLSEGGTGGIINTGAQINTLTIVGGRIQNRIKNINSVTRNVWFDRRFSQPGFAPPWFPATMFTPAGISSATVVPTIQRTQWVNMNAL